MKSFIAEASPSSSSTYSKFEEQLIRVKRIVAITTIVLIDDEGFLIFIIIVPPMKQRWVYELLNFQFADGYYYLDAPPF